MEICVKVSWEGVQLSKIKKKKFWQRLIYNLAIPEAYSEACQISKTERFAKIVNGEKPISILAKRSILDVWQGSECTSDSVLWLKILKSTFEGIHFCSKAVGL